MTFADAWDENPPAEFHAGPRTHVRNPDHPPSKWQLGRALCGAVISHHTWTTGDPDKVTCQRCWKKYVLKDPDKKVEI